MRPYASNHKKVGRREEKIWEDRYAARALSYFKFTDLPTEIAIEILILATCTSAYWKTYHSLVSVSRRMQALVYDSCFSYIPIMMHIRKHVESFHALLRSHPAIGPHVRAIWFVAGVSKQLETTLGLSILQSCAGISHLACNINLLKSLISSKDEFVHHKLKHLTLIEPVIPWAHIFGLSAGRQLFAQLTHFRVNGVTKFVAPEFCFASLTHLSFTSHEVPSLSTCGTPYGSKQFPVLQQIVPSIPYMLCRTKDPKALRMQGLMVDGRIDVAACPKKWKEADIWEGARRGGKDLWVRAGSGEFLEKSRATFIQYSRYDDFDDSDYEFGGESGL